MGNLFNQEFQAFLKSLNDADVRYVLVGGYSVIYYGFPRTTGDMDVFVEVSLENYKSLCKAFETFDLSVFDMTEHNFLENEKVDVFSFGRPPMSIEILKRISGVAFEEAYQDSVVAQIDGIHVRVISKEHLIKNKQTSARYKDLNDLENLDLGE